MRIRVPWPDLSKAFEGSSEIGYACLEAAPLKAPIWVLDLFRQDGTFVEDWELRLWQLKAQYPQQAIFLHATALPPALILPTHWELKGFLIHGPTWMHLHELPCPPPLLEQTLPEGWQFLSPTFLPPQASVERLQRFLSRLQVLRRALKIDFRASTLFYTKTDTAVYTHFSLQELEAHVATIRR